MRFLRGFLSVSGCDQLNEDFQRSSVYFISLTTLNCIWLLTFKGVAVHRERGIKPGFMNDKILVTYVTIIMITIVNRYVTKIFFSQETSRSYG